MEPARSGGTAEGTEEEREDRRVWMAHAETALTSPARPHLWADGQFHILEMQTSKPPPSPTASRFTRTHKSSCRALCHPLIAGTCCCTLPKNGAVIHCTSM